MRRATKIIGIIGILFLIAIYRWHANGLPLNIYETLKEVESVGTFFDFEEPWEDVQYIRYNIENLTNLWTAKEGETYIEYTFSYQEIQNPVDVIKTVNGRTMQYVGQTTKVKVEIVDILDVFALVGESFQFILQTAMFTGKLVIDVFFSVIRCVYGFFRIIVAILFH